MDKACCHIQLNKADNIKYPCDCRRTFCHIINDDGTKSKLCKKHSKLACYRNLKRELVDNSPKIADSPPQKDNKVKRDIKPSSKLLEKTEEPELELELDEESDFDPQLDDKQLNVEEKREKVLDAIEKVLDKPNDNADRTTKKVTKKQPSAKKKKEPVKETDGDSMDGDDGGSVSSEILKEQLRSIKLENTKKALNLKVLRRGILGLSIAVESKFPQELGGITQDLTTDADIGDCVDELAENDILNLGDVDPLSRLGLFMAMAVGQRYAVNSGYCSMYDQITAKLIVKDSDNIKGVPTKVEEPEILYEE